MVHIESRNTRRMMFAGMFAAAIAAAVLVAVPCAQAAQTGPYTGYKSGGSVHASGYIHLSTRDERGVAEKKREPYIWSLNTSDKANIQKMKGISYNKKKNTLTLKNANYPAYSLSASGMGTGFKIKVVGKKNALATIEARGATCYSSKGAYLGKGYPCSVTFTGKGSLTINKKKYEGNAVSLYGNNTKSALTFAKGVKVDAYAFGTYHVVYANSTTVKKNTSAIAIKGRASSLQRRTGMTPARKYYKTDYNVIVYKDSASSTTVYKKGNSYYTVADEYDNYDAENEREVTYRDLRPVKLVTGAYFLSDTDNVTMYGVDEEAWKGFTKVNGSKVVNRYSTRSMTALNKGAYYGRTADNAATYFDTKDRCTYYNKWDVYKKVAKIGEYIFVEKVKSVANSKNLPKGYKGTVAESYKASYAHALANERLTIR